MLLLRHCNFAEINTGETQTGACRLTTNKMFVKMKIHLSENESSDRFIKSAPHFVKHQKNEVLCKVLVFISITVISATVIIWVKIRIIGWKIVIS